MATHVAPARPLPPIGAVLLCLERGSTAAYPVTVERHLGRYFYAGDHRFHVYDDWEVGTTKHTWRTAAAMVWLASPEEQATAAAEEQAAAVAKVWLASFEEPAAAEAKGRCLMAATRSMDGPIDGSPTLSMAEVQWLPPVAPLGPPEPPENW